MRDFAFRLSRQSVPAERVRLVFLNTGSVLHDWVVPGQKRLRSRQLPPRGHETLVVALRKGVLHFLCDIPGHAKLGMKGVLAVGGAKLTGGGPPPPPLPPPVSRHVQLTNVASHLDRPVLVTAPPGATGELEVVEQSGTIRRFVDGVEQTAPFLDLSGQVRLVSETGLLGLAFAPDYVTSHRLYVDYNGLDGNGDLHIVEYRTYAQNTALVDPGSARELLHIVKPWENHNGGMLQFGPDGHLYISVGDGDSGVLHPPGTFAQTRDDLLGDILRIDPEPGPNGAPYTVPAENPFIEEPGVRPEIWAYGLRNPWRFWIDPPTGTMVIGDVGLGDREELDVVPGSALAHGGENFGWPCFEGTAVFDTTATCPNAVPPALSYDHHKGCSVIGGVIARDPRLPQLAGRFLYGDLCSGAIRSMLYADGQVIDDAPVGPFLGQVMAFGEDGLGRIYASSLADSSLYRLDPATSR
jgi:glucose/arabinose dehydrogenase